MKARAKCPVCHRTVSQHCLLYTHVCPEAALGKKPKMKTVEEKFEEQKAPEAEQQEEEVIEEVIEPPKKVRVARTKQVQKYVPGDSDDEPVTGPGAPKSFSDRLYERGDRDFLGVPEAPPPPPLVHSRNSRTASSSYCASENGSITPPWRR